MGANPAERLAVVDRLHLFFVQIRVLRAQRLIGELQVWIRGHVAFAGGERVVARPERDAAVGGDQHEAAMMRHVARGPRSQHERQADRESGERQRLPLPEQPQAGQRDEEQRGRPHEDGQPGDDTQDQGDFQEGLPGLRERVAEQEREAETDGPEQRLAEGIAGDPDQRRVHRRNGRRGDRRRSAAQPERGERNHDHAERADDRLRDLHGRRHRLDGAGAPPPTSDRKNGYPGARPNGSTGPFFTCSS